MLIYDQVGCDAALLMAWMPLPTASQCAIVVSVKAINKAQRSNRLWEDNTGPKS
jgi:hypothetical protein